MMYVASWFEHYGKESKGVRVKLHAVSVLCSLKVSE
jgi:hypothetical protein